MLCTNNPTSQLLEASKMYVSLKLHVFCRSAEGSGFRSHSGTQAPSQHMITVTRKETQELSTRCQMLPPESDTHDLDTKASHVTKDYGKCNLSPVQEAESWNVGCPTLTFPTSTQRTSESNNVKNKMGDKEVDSQS